MERAGDTFLWFIENILVPQLWSGALVVMDKLMLNNCFEQKSLSFEQVDYSKFFRLLFQQTLVSLFLLSVNAWREKPLLL